MNIIRGKCDLLSSWSCLHLTTELHLVDYGNNSRILAKGDAQMGEILGEICGDVPPPGLAY